MGIFFDKKDQAITMYIRDAATRELLAMYADTVPRIAAFRPHFQDVLLIDGDRYIVEATTLDPMNDIITVSVHKKEAMD